MATRRATLGWMGSVLLPGLGCSSSTTSLQIRGSDSEVNLVQRLGEAFMERRAEVSVAVTGGGSGTGIAALLDGTCDLANSSRSLKAGEKLLALRKGCDPVATLFATDALTVIVNADNPTEALSVAEVGAMFGGRVDAWPGGAKVVAYGRQSSSGTYGFFREAVVKADYAPTVRQMNGNAQIVEGVALDPGGVGYVAVGYLEAGVEGVKALRIRPAEGEPAVHPLDEEAVLDDRYPIARPLYQYTDGVPRGAGRAFLRFELSSEGEAIVREMGFYPLVRAWRHRNAHLEAG